MGTRGSGDEQVRRENRKDDERYEAIQRERDAAKRRGFSHNTAALFALEGLPYSEPSTPARSYPASASAANLQFVGLSTYVGDERSPGYRTWVAQDQVDALRVRVDLKDRYHSHRTDSDPEHTYAVLVRLYHPDGVKTDDFAGDICVRRDWEYFSWTCAPARRHESQLRPGIYGIEAFVQGEAMGRSWFLIAGDSPDQRHPLVDTGDRGTPSLSEPVPANLRFRSLTFYEHDGSDTDGNTRHMFRTTFDRSATRYVGFWYEIENPYTPETVLATLGRLRPMRYRIMTSIFSPDGTLSWSPTCGMTVPPRERRLSWTHSWGWADPGHWPAGVYGVEASIAGFLMIRDWFRVTDANRTPLSGLLWAAEWARRNPPPWP